MVDFTLTDEQRNLREMAHDFAVKEIRPVAWDYDKDGTWPQDIIDKAWELGLMNSHIEEEYGGVMRHLAQVPLLVCEREIDHSRFLLTAWHGYRLTSQSTPLSQGSGDMADEQQSDRGERPLDGRRRHR